MNEYKRTKAELRPAYVKLVNLLSDGVWRKQAVITAATGLKGPIVRSVCSSWPGEFVGLPSKGYALTRCASSVDVWHAVYSLESRANKIAERARQLRAVATALHGGGGDGLQRELPIKRQAG